MFGEKLLTKSKMSLDEAGYEQFNIVQGEIKTLCEKTTIGWDLVTSELFDKVRKTCFAEGMIYGAAIVSIGIAVGVTIAKHAIKPKQ